MLRRSMTALLALIFLAISSSSASAGDAMIQTAPGVHIHVIDTGRPGSRPTLVLIPGWRLTAHIWNEQMATFSKGRRVIVVDPRSQGESTKTTDGDTPEQRARDLHVVLHRLKAGRTVLVGWSQGVQDVAAYVGQFGTRSIAGIVLVDSTVSHGADAIPSAPKAAAEELGLLALYADDPAGYTRGMMRAIIKRSLPKSEFERLVADALKTPTAVGQAMLITDLFGVDRSPALAKFNRPTLVIASALSAELDAQKAMAKALLDGRVEVVDGAAHAVFVDQPQRFDRILAAFLASLS